jgi:hypothetical protein
MVSQSAYNEDKEAIADVEKANLTLSDSLNPSTEGLFFEPMDAALVARSELPRFLSR